MAVIKKTLFPKNLEKFAVLVRDTEPDSKYFKITELPTTFTGGKNAFLIAGSEALVPDTKIQIELKDAAGNVIYHEPGEGLISASIDGTSFMTEYFEGVSKVVAVYIYNDTAYGPCTLTILGEVSEYVDGNGITTPVPVDWTGKYNVKWQKQIDVNPSLPNTTKIRFYRRPTPTITEIVEPIYRIETGSKVPTGVNQSFADIKLSNLETFAGDVKRVKVFRTSEGTISDYDLIQDILVEAKELLTSFTLSGSVVGNTGIFTQETLSNYWNTGSLNAELTNSRVESGLKLNGSGRLTYTQSLDIKSTNTYEINLDAFYSASTSSNLGIYLSYQSGSNTFSSSVGTLYGIEPTTNLLDQTFPFKLDRDYPTASLFLSQSQGEWHVGNISLKLSEDTAFSPDEVSFITTMPTVVGNETFNFKFEFYDVNNNYVPVAVTQSVLFTGGTTGSAVDVDFIISSSISQSLSQSLDALYQVSSSISGTVTFNSSSISGSLGFVSSSVSGTISNVSSSISQSVALNLSSSLSKVQQLADGAYSGSFISGSIVGETFIFSPVVGGVDGYFSNKFQVGSTNPIVLDASTSTRKIYVGTGTYNNTNTSVYMDSGGQFSLKDKLTWDGSNLSINGSITVSGGNAATNTALTSSLESKYDASNPSGYQDATNVNNASKTAGYVGGWTIASDAIYSGTKDTSGYSTTGITLYGGGSIHAPNFYIDTSGNAFFRGEVTATSGYIGTAASGFSINSSYFRNGTKTSYNGAGTGVYVGTDGIGLGTAFYVSAAGALTATSVNITGTVNATGGTFSGNITATGTISGGTISGATLSGGTINVGPNRFIVDSSGNTTVAGNLSLNTGGTVSIRGYKFFNGGTCTSPSVFLDPGGDFVFRDFDSSGTILGFFRGYTTITNCGVPGLETTTRTIVNTAVDGFTWGQYNGSVWATLNGTELNVRGDVVANTSDRRLKTNIKNIDSPLEKISKINGVYFNWNDKAKELTGKDTEIREVGFIAQEVQSILPEIVKQAPFDIIEHTNQSKSGENYLTIQYEKIVPLLVESIKELKKEIEELKNNK
jgi:hypothetical protein